VRCVRDVPLNFSGVVDSVRRKLLIGFFSLLVALIASELAVRILAPLEARSVASSAERVGRRTFNSRGLRDIEYPSEHDTLRIVALGDSFTFGVRVKLENSWPKVLERKLRLRGLDKIEVLNAGRPGTDSAWQADFYDKAVAYYRPNLVLQGFILNDCTRTCANCGPVKIRKLLDDLLRKSQREPRSALLDLLRYSYLRQRLTKRTHWNYTRAYVNQAPVFRRCVASFARLKQSVEAQGGMLVIVIYPLLYQLDEAYPFLEVHRKMQQIWSRQGIQSIDLTPAFFGQKETELWLDTEDSHPNAKANQIAGTYLSEQLMPILAQLSQPGVPQDIATTLPQSAASPTS
jgi:lysophospholipase L1-like esterase